MKMSAFVQTVRGRIAPEDLGVTLSHEHLTADWPWALGETRERDESISVVNHVVKLLQECGELGIKTLVDVGTESFAPSPLFMLAVSIASGIHIICSTGVYAEHRLPPPGWVHPPATPESVAARFVAAATHGVLGSGVKPGVIKVASSAQAITATEERALQGAAIAQRATGLPITTHTESSLWADEQVDVFEAAGADLDRVVIGHMGWNSKVTNNEAHRRLARRGVMIGLDLIGDRRLSNEVFADVAIDLIEQGATKQILFSHDAIGAPRGMAESFGPASVARTYLTMSRELLPLMRERGVDEKTIETILIDNPRRVFTIDPERYPGAITTLGREKTFDPVASYKLNWRP
jgi:phosphotriesterase-related protein